MAQIVQSQVEPAESPSAAEADASPIADRPVVSEQTISRGADIRVVFQGGLFMLALLAALYAGREIVLHVSRDREHGFQGIMSGDFRRS
jgi:hypothetical protein